MLSLGQRMLVSAAVAFVLGVLLYGLLVGWEARHPLRVDGATTAAEPTFAPLNATYVEASAEIATLSADYLVLTLTTAAPDALRLCAAQPEGEPTCITLAELRERRN